MKTSGIKQARKGVLGKRDRGKRKIIIRNADKNGD